MPSETTSPSRRSILRMASLGLPAASLLHPDFIGSASGREVATPSPATSPSSQKFPIRILYNENPLGCAKSVRRVLAEVATKTQFYPFEYAQKLSAMLREKHGLQRAQSLDGSPLGPQSRDEEHGIVLGCGSSEILNAVALAYSLSGGNFVEPAPSYQAVVQKAVGRPGSEVQPRRVPLTKSGELDVDALLAACDANTRVLVVTNPNNPTGNALSAEKLEQLVLQTPRHVLLFIDEAYIDFLPDSESRSAIRFALQSDNVLVARTFSKIHGLAALRCGYAVGHTSILARLEPFRMGLLGLNVSGLAAACASLTDSEFQRRSRQMAAASRQQISTQLKTLGFEVVESHGACLWADWARDTSSLVDKLAADGVLIASGRRWNQPNCVRISVGTPWQTSQLLQKLTDAVQAS